MANWRPRASAAGCCCPGGNHAARDLVAGEGEGEGQKSSKRLFGLVGMATSQRPKIIPGIKPCDRQRFHPSIHSPANRGEITPICRPALPFTLHEYGVCSCTLHCRSATTRSGFESEGDFARFPRTRQKRAAELGTAFALRGPGLGLL